MAERVNKFIWAAGHKATEVAVLSLEKRDPVSGFGTISEAVADAKEYGHPDAQIFKISTSVERVK